LGEAPYDIFVRWKALSEQAIGWEPDINDGVRLNIRPFLSVPDVSYDPNQLFTGKKTGVKMLTQLPGISWTQNRVKVKVHGSMTII